MARTSRARTSVRRASALGRTSSSRVATAAARSGEHPEQPWHLDPGGADHEPPVASGRDRHLDQDGRAGLEAERPGGRDFGRETSRAQPSVTSQRDTRLGERELEGDRRLAVLDEPLGVELEANLRQRIDRDEQAEDEGEAEWRRESDDGDVAEDDGRQQAEAGQCRVGDDLWPSRPARSRIVGAPARAPTRGTGRRAPRAGSPRSHRSGQERQPVGEAGDGERLDVVGQDEFAPCERGAGAGATAAGPGRPAGWHRPRRR